MKNLEEAIKNIRLDREATNTALDEIAKTFIKEEQTMVVKVLL